MELRRGHAAPPDRHAERVRHELRRPGRMHRPANDEARTHIEPGRDVEPATGVVGEDYRWRCREGFHCFNPSVNLTDPSCTMPVLEYSHAQGACSISGGYRYRGTQIPSLRGAYLYGDYCTGTIGSATQTGATWTANTLFTTTIRISSFGEDVSGELYVLDVAKGIVYRLLARGVIRQRAVR